MLRLFANSAIQYALFKQTNKTKMGVVAHPQKY
nr:MAG TPA: hypothetical protein [Caudoviricetes sp.]